MRTGPPRVMPFGKYRGRLLRDLPGWYVEWLREQSYLRDPLKSALDAEAARRIDENRGTDFHTETPDVCPDPQIANAVITAGLHALAKRNHPDRAGDHARMVAVNLCVEWLREKVRKND